MPPAGAVEVERAEGGVADPDEVGGGVDDRDEPGHRRFGARTLGDVPEAVDAAHHLAVEALRQRVALEDAAVAQAQRVEALGLGLGVEPGQLVEEGLGLEQLVEHERGRPLGAVRGEQLGRDAPHRGELLVEARDAAVTLDHQDAVGGRLERRLEQRQRACALLFGQALLRHVAQVQHHAADRGRRELVDGLDQRRGAACRRGAGTGRNPGPRRAAARSRARARAASRRAGWRRPARAGSGRRARRGDSR